LIVKIDNYVLHIPPWHWTLCEYMLSRLWTPLLHVHVSLLHGYSNTLDTIFHENTNIQDTVILCPCITVTPVLLY